MLRGQGSLKELLGQSVVASSYARRKRLKAEADAAAAATARPTASKRAKPSSSKSAPAGTDAAADAAAKMFSRAKNAVKAESQQALDLARVRPDPPDAATPRRLDWDSSGIKPEANVPAQPGRTPGQEPEDAGDDRGEGSTLVCCPLCSRALSGSSDLAINSHIGEFCCDGSVLLVRVRSCGTWCRTDPLHHRQRWITCDTADHCLARTASAKRVKQRTVTALFGSASAAAAQRCRAMLQHNHAQQQTALRSTSAPPEIQHQQQQPYQQLAQDTGAGSQQAEVDVDLPTLQQATDGGQHIACAAARHASATILGTVPVQTPAAPIDLLDQETQPLDAMLQLRQQDLLTAQAAGDGAESASHSSPDTPSCDGAPQADASSLAKPPSSVVPGGVSGPVLAAVTSTAAGANRAAEGSDDEPGMHTPQRQIISRQAVLPCASPLATVKSFTTCVVGRRFQTEAE